ncbi:MAG: hypothetical protein WCO30_01755 [bacterium]
METLKILESEKYPKYKVIQRVITKEPSLKSEIVRTLITVAVVSAIIFGISFAEDLPFLKTSEPIIKRFSATGLVSKISDSEISLGEVESSDGSNVSTYTFNINTIERVESKNYDRLALTDLKVGDRIVVQGKDTDGVISVARIISFSTDESSSLIALTASSSLVTLASTSSSTTDSLVSSSTTINIAEQSATSSLENIGSTTDQVTASTSSDIIDSTSTPIITLPSISIDNATTSIESSSSTQDEVITSDTTSLEVIATSTNLNPPTIVDFVKDVVTTLTNTISGNNIDSNPSENTPTEPVPEPIQ